MTRSAVPKKFRGSIFWWCGSLGLGQNNQNEEKNGRQKGGLWKEGFLCKNRTQAEWKNIISGGKFMFLVSSKADFIRTVNSKAHSLFGDFNCSLVTTCKNWRNYCPPWSSVITSSELRDAGTCLAHSDIEMWKKWLWEGKKKSLMGSWLQIQNYGGLTRLRMLRWVCLENCHLPLVISFPTSLILQSDHRTCFERFHLLVGIIDSQLVCPICSLRGENLPRSSFSWQRGEIIEPCSTRSESRGGARNFVNYFKVSRQRKEQKGIHESFSVDQ